MAAKQDDMDWIWGFAIALFAIIVLHQPAFSVQKVLIGSRSFSFVEMSLLKFLAGFLTSLAIVGLCSALLRRRPSKPLVWSAVITQLLWLEVEWGFSFVVADVGEFLVRFAEEAGTLTSGMALLIALRFWPRSELTAKQ